MSRYPTPNGDGLSPLVDRIRAVEAQLRDLTRPTGTAMVGLVGHTVAVTAAAVAAARIPAPPAAPSVVASGAWNGDGAAYSQLAVSWAAVSVGEDGAAISVQGYEVWSAGEYSLLTAATGLTATVGPIDPGQVLDISVRARSADGIWSAWSGSVSVLTVNPTTLPASPTAPTLTQDLGTVMVAWDGMLVSGGGPVGAPKQIKHIIVEQASSASGPWVQVGQQLTSAGAVTIPGIGALTTAWFRLVAVDRVGNESVPTDGVPITVAAIGLTDLDQAVADAIAAAQGRGDQGVLDAEAAQTRADAAAASALTANNAAGTAQTQASTAQDTAATAQTTADAKGRVIYAATAPASTDDRVTQNLWIDIGGSPARNAPYRWTGTAWLIVTDQKVIDAASAAATAQAAATAAAASASTAQDTADGKNRTTYSTAIASGAGTRAGDIWFRVASGLIIGQWEWTGTAWASRTLDNAVIANLDAGKISTGYLDVAGRILAGSIAVEKLTVASFDNMLPDPSFEDATFLNWVRVGGTILHESTSGRDGRGAARITSASGAQYLLVSPANTIKVEEGSSYRISMWVRSTVAVPIGGLTVAPNMTSTTGVNTWAGSQYARNTVAIPANTWARVSGSVDIAAGIVGMRIACSSEPPLSSGTVLIDDASVTRMGSAELLVDGSIDGKVITGALIRSAASGQRVELTSAGLKGYDAAGAVKTSVGTDGVLTAVDAVITGTVKTAPSGQRVELNSQMAKFYSSWSDTISGSISMTNSGAPNYIPTMRIDPDDNNDLEDAYVDMPATLFVKDRLWVGNREFHACTRGIATFTTDASGIGYITHGLGSVPVAANLQSGYQSDTVSPLLIPTVGALTSTQIQVVAFRGDANARLANTQIVLHWVVWA